MSNKVRLFILCALFIATAGCSSQTLVATATPSNTNYPVPVNYGATATDVVVPTKTVGTLPSDCTGFQVNSQNKAPFGLVLPPNTLIGRSGAAAGTSELQLCTPNSTEVSISNYFASYLTNNGWRQYDANKDTYDTAPCGASFTWVKSQLGAFRWGQGFEPTMRSVNPPLWNIIFCTMPGK